MVTSQDFVHRLKLSGSETVKEMGKPESPADKPLGAKERTNIKLHPRIALLQGFEPGPHWRKASALTAAPSFLP